MNTNSSPSNVSQSFFKYVPLNILGMLGLSCYILADTFFVANGVGSDGLTALNLVLPVYSFISGLGLLLGMGGATAFSICRGEGDPDRAQGLFGQTLVLALAAGLLLTGAGLCLVPTLVRLLGADAAILPLAASYLRTILLFSCAFILNNTLLCFVRNDGNPGLSMAAMITGSLSNVVLDYIFIFPLGMGMFGAAFATGLAPLISMAVLSLHWRSKGRSLQLSLRTPSSSNAGRILSLGLPSFVTEFSSGLIMLFFNFTILGLAGNTGVAAYGIIANLALIATAVFTGISQGVQPLLSRSFGRNEKSALGSFLRMALLLAAAAGLLFWISGTLLADSIIGIFNKADDPLLAEMAGRGILLYFPAFLPAGINIIAAAYLAAVGKPRPSFTLSVLRGCGAVIPILLLLPRLLGMDGVWLSIPLAEIVTMLVLLKIRKGCE